MEQQISEPTATYQNILDLPETLVGEIINGRLVAHPRLNWKALFAKEKLGGVLQSHFDHIATDQTRIDGERSV
jgi:hypothetical protein